jgi:hypothetical protein
MLRGADRCLFNSTCHITLIILYIELIMSRLAAISSSGGILPGGFLCVRLAICSQSEAHLHCTHPPESLREPTAILKDISTGTHRAYPTRDSLYW